MLDVIFRVLHLLAKTMEVVFTFFYLTRTIGWQVTGIPVVFVSALEGKGRIAVMREIVETYEKWCLRLPTARLNRWVRKVSLLIT